MSFAPRVVWVVTLAAPLALVACANYGEDDDSPYQGGPETCLTAALECGPNASCGYDADAQPVCTCDEGFGSDGSNCVQAEECTRPSDCSPDATCSRFGDLEVCACNAGFEDASTGTGNRQGTNCVDVDECTGDDAVECPEHSACQNLPGSVQCVCDAGYAPDPAAVICVLADRCAAEPPDCPADSHCVNTASSTACVCDARFTTAPDGCVPATPVGAGPLHGCAIDAAESVWCWGEAGVPALELGPPARMGSETGFVQLSQDGTCGLRRDGSLWCWWYGVSREDGQLLVDWQPVGGAGGWLKTAGGWGTRAGGTIWSWDPSASPIVPVQYGTATDWTDVCPGTVATCGTKLDGTAWCWATGVAEATQVGEAADYVSLSCAGGMTCGLRGNGRADCFWPRLVPADTEGGDPTLVAVPFALRAGFDRPTATVIEDVTEVSVGGNFVCAIRDGGGLWCAGTFGDPALRAGDPLVVDSEPWLGPIDLAADWRSVASGASHACAVRHDAAARTDTTYCWGANAAGQLGRESAGTMTPVSVAL